MSSSGIAGTFTDIETPGLNIVKFSVYRTAAANTGNASFAAVAFDTEIFDTSSNIASGVFTVPLTGFYFFNWSLQVTTGGAAETFTASLFVNGVENLRGNQLVSQGINTMGIVGSGLIMLTAGQTVDVRAFDGSAARALNTGAAICYFQGYLMSVT